MGSPRAPVLTKSGSLRVTLMSIITVPSLVTWGFTVRFRLASTNTVCTPWALTTEMGIETPCSMCASLLSMVEMRGDDRMRT